METIYDQAFKQTILDETIKELMLKQFLHESIGSRQIEDFQKVDTFDHKVSKASLLASILACSSKPDHQQKALSFAVLAYLDRKDLQYASFCYIILSRLQNIQQGKHLKGLIDKDKFTISFNEEINLELATNRALAALKMPGSNKTIYLNEFQKTIWAALERQHRLMAISGPTSAGKSFMIQNYIIKFCKEKTRFSALYIVPTKALIAEVSAELRNRLHGEEVSIRVAVGHIEETNERSILVVTPERCLQLLRKKDARKPIDFIFLDEIQKVEDPERGVTLEHVLWELLQLYPDAQVVLAGPYLTNLNKTMVDLCGITGESIESKFTPVYQLKTIFTLSQKSPNKIGITIKGEKGQIINTSIPSEKPLYLEMKKSQPKTIAYLVNTFGNGYRNIIYAPTRRTAERFSIALADLMPNYKEIQSIDKTKKKRIAELIAFLKDEIHPDCALVKSLEKRIAFHHGLMPEMAKLEVETLYRTGAVENIVCTTTLLEGVNLPADKIFVYRPWKRNKNNLLNSFDFGNLIGRAGRVKSSLNGSVYCIELEDEPWAKEKLEADPIKEVIPATTSATYGEKKNQLVENVTKLSTEMKVDDRSIISTIIFLRQKAIKGKDILSSYLKSKNLSDDDIEKISKGIIFSLKDREISDELVELNPTIDPLLQDKLYKEIMKQGIEEWAINKTPLIPKGGGPQLPFQDRSFYWQFIDVTERLNDIFDFVGDIKRKQFRKWYSPRTARSVAYYGVDWVEERPTSYIIRSELDRLKQNNQNEYNKPGTLDRMVLEVTEHITYEVCFELVKYFKLLTDILDSLVTDSQKENYSIALLMPEMLELGAHHPNVIAMIRLGINRSAAIEAAQFMPERYDGSVVDWLINNQSLLKPLVKRHLKNIGILPKETGDSEEAE